MKPQLTFTPPERDLIMGYAHPAYAASLCEFGRVRALPRCGGFLLERGIPSSSLFDAMGPYPLFACGDWSQVGSDLNELGEDLVAVSLVADPFGVYNPPQLRAYFDVFVAFKQHFLVDYNSPCHPCAHHRYYARWASKRVQVEVVCDNAQFSSEWASLYGQLVQRHNLSGLKAFSLGSLNKQLQVPGSVLFRAAHDGLVVAAHHWFVSGDVAYSHLLAISKLGYRLCASYAMYSAAIEYFNGKVRFLDLGAGAGTLTSAGDRLAQFKKGWGNATRPAYFCGRVLNRAAYKQLVARHITGTTAYFPAYRAGEFS